MNQKIYCLRRSKIVDCTAEVVKGHRYQQIRCPAEPKHERSRPILGPIAIDPEESGTTECLWTWISDCLLNEAVIEEMRSAGFIGFETDIVEMTNPSRLGISYAQFRPIGWGGIAHAESGVHQTYYCEYCGHMRYSPLLRADRLFDSKQWDGSDVFMIWPMPGFIFVAERLATFIRDLNISGMELVAIENLSAGKDGFTPGRLSYSMPADRASHIGKPLGID